MDQVILNDILPTVIFFVIFSLVFTLLELIVVLILNNLEKRNWEWLIDVIIRSEVHHGKIIRYSILIFIGILIIGCIKFTPLVGVLTTASGGFKLFALLLGLVMLLFYSINVRKVSKIRIEKKIYGIVFFIISLALYILIIVTANESYATYNIYVNKNFIKPAVEKVENVLEDREKNQLLSNARQQYLTNGCRQVDYTKEEKEILMKNILLLANEPDLAFGDKIVDLDNPEEALRGTECSDGEKTLLLVENGSWYLVNEEYIQYLK